MNIAWRQVFVAFALGMILQSSGVHTELDSVLSNKTGINSTDINQSLDFGTEPLDEEETAKLVHQKINEERTERGLKSLQYSDKLEEIARGHSEDMAERNYFSHDSPEGEDFQDRYQEAGYNCMVSHGGMRYKGAENIAQTHYQELIQTDTGTVRHESEEEVAQGIVNQWMNSQGHRENILQPYWNYEGIGIYVTEDDKVYATQNFC